MNNKESPFYETYGILLPSTEECNLHKQANSDLTIYKKLYFQRKFQLTKKKSPTLKKEHLETKREDFQTCVIVK